MANWLLELVKLRITADLFRAFIQTVAHPLTWPEIHNRSANKTFSSHPNSDYNFQVTVFKSVLAVA